MRVLASIILLVLIALAGSVTGCAAQNNDKPISEDGVMRLLEHRVQPAALIRAIESHGVGFQLTSIFEDELASAGGYLGKKGLNTLLTAIRANFRPPANRPFV